MFSTIIIHGLRNYYWTGDCYYNTIRDNDLLSFDGFKMYMEGLFLLEIRITYSLGVS